MNGRTLVFLILVFLSCLFGRAGYAQCYTNMAPVISAGCSLGDAIETFTLAGMSTTGNYGCSGTSAYTMFNSPVRSLTAGVTYPFTATTGTSGTYPYNQFFAIWIDLNKDNKYDSTEMLYSSNAAATSHTGTITIPPYVTTGTNVRMRTRCSYVNKLLPNQACAQTAYGETEDYFVNIIQPCSVPAITHESGDTSVTCGFGNARFSVDAQGTNMQYQWQLKSGAIWANISNNGAYSGATTKHLFINGYNPDFGGNKYRCVVSNSCGAAVSNAMTLYIDSSPVAAQPSSQVVCEGTSVTLPFTMASTSGLVHTYQWYVKTPSSTIQALSSGGMYNGVDTPLLVMSGVTANMSGSQYFCIVDNGCWSTDTVTLIVQKMPAITDQPDHDTACVNETATFSVQAMGNNVQYQWQIFNPTGWQNLTNSAIYNNVKTSTLTVHNPDLTNNGKAYRCQLTGDCDSTYTDPAQLTVYDGFSIVAQPQDSTACVNSVATFRVGTLSTSALTYQWMAITSAGMHVPVDTPLYLYGNSAEMTVLSAYQKLHGVKFYCIISNRCTSDTTLTATLFVDPCGNDHIETGVKTAGAEEVISVYPNPANGSRINIAAAFNAGQANIKIVNSMGVVVQNAVYNIPGNNIITLDIDRLPQGVYSIQVQEDEQNVPRVVRFVKE